MIKIKHPHITTVNNRDQFIIDFKNSIKKVHLVNIGIMSDKNDMVVSEETVEITTTTIKKIA